MGSEYWQGLLGWIEEQLLNTGKISPGDQYLFTLTDDPHEAVRIIDEFYKEHALTPNF
jgi:predicted Rossmann-fold nucleotide-binding protein